MGLDDGGGEGFGVLQRFLSRVSDLSVRIKRELLGISSGSEHGLQFMV